MRRPDATPRWLPPAAAAVTLLLQILALLNPDLPLVDCEERYNAAHAVELLRGHAGDLWRLQYQDFCGGCSLVSALGALTAALGGASLFTWKLVPAGFAAAAAWIGALALGRQVGLAGAVIFALLVALPPYTWLRLSLIGWGNHYECGVFALAALGMLAARPSGRSVGALGLALGLGLWVGFSAAFAAAACGLTLLARRQWRDLGWLAAGALLGVAPWGLRWLATGASPFGTIYHAGESTPRLLRAPQKLALLLHPAQLAGAFGLPRRALGLPMGLCWGAALLACGALAPRGPALARLAALFLACWLTIYALVGFSIEPSSGLLLSATSGLRYLAPIYPVAFALVAAVAGDLWGRGGWRRGLGAALAAGPLACGLLTRAAALSPPFPDAAALSLEGAQYDYYREQASYLLDGDDHAGCDSGHPRSRALHAYALGRAAAAAALDSDTPLATLEKPAGLDPVGWSEGLGAAVIDHMDPEMRGAPSALAAAERALAGLATGAEAALREAYWRRIYADRGRVSTEPWRVHEACARGAAALKGDAARAAWARACGRRAARDGASWARPDQLPVAPPAELPAAAWIEGFGFGLGEEWGPRAAIPRPSGLPSDQEATLLAGYREGVARQWLTAATLPDAPALVEGATGLSGPRWWAPPPQLHCSCRATCE